MLTNTNSNKCLKVAYAIYRAVVSLHCTVVVLPSDNDAAEAIRLGSDGIAISNAYPAFAINLYHLCVIDDSCMNPFMLCAFLHERATCFSVREVVEYFLSGH